jgi:hypothetical protein
MVYVPPVSMEDYYVNYDGYDLRELDHKFHYLRYQKYSSLLLPAVHFTLEKLQN